LIYLSQHVFSNDDANINESTFEQNFSVGYAPDKKEVLVSYSTLSIAPIIINIVDLNGKSVLTKKLGSSLVGAHQHWVKMPTHIPNGMYVVHFFIGNKAFSAPISIQN
jgi:hypothetical protein